ncbi:MAG: GAF domain-containing protein [Sphingobacteriales bacterium]|nr:MAG: GAF domain-containing protein [Sphingobacteriales bacterium]
METREQARVRVLHQYNLLDTPPDGSFDKMTRLAAKLFNIPIAIISLVDSDRIWFKSKYGLDVNQISRDPGLCASAILSDDIYLVEDARNDSRTLANPLVAGEFGLQFYAAAPLRTHDGYNLGTFCVLDKQKRYFNSEQQEALKLFAEVVMEEVEFRLIAHNKINELQQKLDQSGQSKVA